MCAKKSESQALSSPIKWAGGKSRLRKQIIALLPRDSNYCYVEVFGGGAWVLFGKEPSSVEILNDIDTELINFFRIVRETPEDLIKSFDLELVSRAEFERLAKLPPNELTNLQRAHRFYYLIMAGWGGELNYPRFQTSITDGGHGNRLIGALKHLRERIEPIHKRLSTVIIENLDWRECIDRYDRLGTVMYLDPPYPENGVNYFHNMRDWESHKLLAERLKSAKCRWILSSYNTEEIHRLYGDYNIIPVTISSGMKTAKSVKNGASRVIVEEVIICNYGLNTHAYEASTAVQLRFAEGDPAPDADETGTA
jgi:DNA adenine methylase